MIRKKVHPAFWLMGVLAVVCVLPSAKPPTVAQAVVSDPNPRNALWNGTGPPVVPQGEDGDFYIDTTPPKAVYGPRTASAWPGPFSMVGAAGGNGTNGTNGSNGSAATVAVGTVSTGAPGSSATVTNAGTSSAAIFNMSIPRGDVGATGSTGAPGVDAFAVPTTRSLSLATAYQATNTAKPAVVTVNLSSVATISLSGGTTNTATVYIGATSAVASGTGTAMCNYTNSNTGALTIGLNLSTTATTTCTLALPAGWFFSIIQSSGTVTITNARDQQVG